MRNTLTGTVAAIALAIATVAWSPRPQPVVGLEALAASDLADVVASEYLAASGCYLTVAGGSLALGVGVARSVARPNTGTDVRECSDETLEAAALLILALCWDQGGEGWMIIRCNEDGIDLLAHGCGPLPEIITVTPVQR